MLSQPFRLKTDPSHATRHQVSASTPEKQAVYVVDVKGGDPRKLAGGCYPSLAAEREPTPMNGTERNGN
jgi:hypothetical protein